MRKFAWFWLFFNIACWVLNMLIWFKFGKTLNLCVGIANLLTSLGLYVSLVYTHD